MKKVELAVAVPRLVQTIPVPFERNVAATTTTTTTTNKTSDRKRRAKKSVELRKPRQHQPANRRKMANNRRHRPILQPVELASTVRPEQITKAECLRAQTAAKFSTPITT